MIKYVIKVQVPHKTPIYISIMNNEPSKTISIQFAELFLHEDIAKRKIDSLVKCFPADTFSIQTVNVDITEVQTIQEKTQ